MQTEAVIMEDMRRVADVYPAGSDHFVYTSGMHGNGYVDYRPLGLAGNEKLLREVTTLLFRKALSNSGFINSSKIVVIGPETMGAKMVEMIKSANLMGHLPTFSHIQTLSLLKDPKNKGQFIWEFDPSEILKSAQIIWMDDLLNMGSTAQTSIKMIEAQGGKVGVVATFGDRCNITATELGVARIVSLEQHTGFTVHNPKCICSLCEAEVPIVRKPGHGHAFEKENPNYSGGFIDSPAQTQETA